MHDPEGRDAEQRADPADVTDSAQPAGEPNAIAPLPEGAADEEVAEAEARADAARARLSTLRQAAGEDVGAADVEQRPGKSIRTRMRFPRRPGRPRRPRRPGRPRWLRRPGRTSVAAGVGIVLFVASVAASGYMVSAHRAVVHRQQLSAEFATAARQGVTALMSIDPDHARTDVQRMIDASTGDLNNQLSVMSVLMVKKAEDSKVGSKVTVEAVAVESFGDNSGVVLVAAKTDATGPDNAKPPPALFRVSVSMDRDGGQLKMSKVDFLQ